MLSYINTHILPSFRCFNRVQLPNLQFPRTWQVHLHLPLSAERIEMFNGQCVKTLENPCSSHQNSWDLWMFIPLELIIIGFDPSLISLAKWKSLCWLNDSVSSCRKKKRMCCGIYMYRVYCMISLTQILQQYYPEYGYDIKIYKVYKQ